MTKIDAAKFVFNCKNWYEVALPIARHVPPSKVILRNGTLFASHSLYWADMYAIFFQHIYTPGYLLIEPKDVVVDIGANIGVFALFASQHTSGRVYAVEPSSKNFAALQQNIAINARSNIIPLHCAVSDHSGTEPFYDGDASQHHRLQKVMMTHPPQSCVSVPSVTLYDLMDRYQLASVDFLKLDCEGAEEAILRSTPLHYLRRIRKIALEFHNHLTEADHTHLARFLQHAGFETRIHWDGHSVLGFIYAWQ